MDRDEEIRAVDRAESLDPRPDIDKHVNRIKHKFGRTAQALRELLRGVDIDSLTLVEQRKIIREANEIINALNDEIPDDVDEAVRDIYEHGRARALIAFGFFAELEEARRFLRSRKSTDSRAHRAFLASNIEVMTSDLLKATQNVQAQVKTTVRRVSAEALRESYRRQEGVESTARELRKQLEKAGDIAIIDRIGRRWSLDFYAETVAATKLVQAHREATLVESENHGAGYLIVSRHGDPCPKCSPWQGRILRIHHGIEGNQPTLDEARAFGLFHPNCKHNVTPVRRLDRVPDWVIV